MMAQAEVKIVLKQPFHKSQIIVDGVDLSRFVRSFKLEGKAGQSVVTLGLELLPILEVTGEVADLLIIHYQPEEEDQEDPEVPPPFVIGENEDEIERLPMGKSGFGYVKAEDQDDQGTPPKLVIGESDSP